MTQFGGSGTINANRQLGNSSPEEQMKLYDALPTEWRQAYEQLPMPTDLRVIWLLIRRGAKTVDLEKMMKKEFPDYQPIQAKKSRRRAR